MNIANLLNKTYEWIELWVTVTFAPKKFISDWLKSKKSNQGILFFLGSQFLAFCLIFFIAIFYFAVYHRVTFDLHIGQGGIGALGSASLLFVGFTILNLILTGLTSAISSIFYKFSKTSITIKQHFDLTFYLSNLDCISLACLFYFFLDFSGSTLFYTVLTIYGIIKLYNLFFAYYFLSKIYNLSFARSILPHFGYTIVFALFNCIAWAVIYLLAIVLVGGLD